MQVFGVQSSIFVLGDCLLIEFIRVYHICRNSKGGIGFGVNWLIGGHYALVAGLATI